MIEKTRHLALVDFLASNRRVIFAYQTLQCQSKMDLLSLLSLELESQMLYFCFLFYKRSVRSPCFKKCRKFEL
uniref:Uncharacterized protein n=1 Tax=Pararge aegeria TaxID=116150 RepID=S4P0A5_9NEOP